MSRPIVRSAVGTLLLATAAIAVVGAVNVSGLQSTAASAAPNVIACRAMESHASEEEPSVTAVVFHQRDKGDGARLGELLVKNSGAAVEIQIGKDGKRQAAHVFRLKSCFGRGLLLLSGGAVAPKDGETFTVTFPAAPDAASH